MYKIVGFCLGLIMFLGLMGCSSVHSDTDVSAEVEKETQTAKEQEQQTDIETEKEPVLENGQMPSITEQLLAVGFNADEVQEIEEIFRNVGLTDIGIVQFGPGTGINELQAFIAPVFGSTQLQVNFTVENRMLCWVELAGIPDHKTQFYVNMFGKPDTKEVLTMTSVTLFDRWEADGETYKTTQDSYQAKFDYENWTITKWDSE